MSSLRPYSDQHEMQEYVSLDPFAVISVVFGLLSIGITLFSMLFLFVIFIAIVSGLISLFRIMNSDGMKSGKWIAVTGMTLAIFFSSLQLTYLRARERMLKPIGVKYAMEWIDMIRDGKFDEAHQMTLGFYNREAAGTDLADYYKNPNQQTSAIPKATPTNEQSPFEMKVEFYSRRGPKLLARHRRDCKISFKKRRYHWRPTSREDLIMLLFDMEYEVDGEIIQDELHVRMKRAVLDDVGVQWAVDYVETLSERREAFGNDSGN